MLRMMGYRRLGTGGHSDVSISARQIESPPSSQQYAQPRTYIESSNVEVLVQPCCRGTLIRPSKSDFRDHGFRPVHEGISLGQDGSCASWRMEMSPRQRAQSHAVRFSRTKCNGEWCNLEMKDFITN